jgi:carbon storage regulator
MLILSRKLNESIVIDGRIIVKVMRVDGEVVKLGIAAPLEVPVHRQEVYEEIRKSNQEALAQRDAQVPKLTKKSAALPTRSPNRDPQERQLKPDKDRQTTLTAKELERK